MLDVASLAFFLLAVLLIMLTPGPDMLYVLARTLREGRVAGFLAVLGVSSGIAVHTLLAAFGLSRLVAAHPLAMEALRYAGAAYLVVLSVMAFRAAPAALRLAAPGEPAAPLDAWKLWRQAFVTNLLNPKAIVFFLAFLPQFVTPGSGSFVDFLLLGVLVVACSSLVNGFVALFAGAARSAFAGRPAFLASQRYVTSGVLVAIAVKMLVR